MPQGEPHDGQGQLCLSLLITSDQNERQQESVNISEGEKKEKHAGSWPARGAMVP